MLCNLSQKNLGEFGVIPLLSRSAKHESWDSKATHSLSSNAFPTHPHPLMSLPLYTSTASGGGGGAPRLSLPPTTTLRPQFSFLSSRTSHIVGATNKPTPKTGKFDSKNRRNSPSSSTTTSKELDKPLGRRATLEKREKEADEAQMVDSFVDDGFVMPDLPGKETDFWEGEKWDGLGFFVQYMWAFGIVFALIACGIAVATFNQGATDFKDTPVYKESIQSRDLLEEPEASNSDVFESNPTEEAPSLE